MMFYFSADSMLCHPRLHPDPQRRRVQGAWSEDVIEETCAGLFQICDAAAYATLFLVFDEF